MTDGEIERGLTNWIRQAMSREGELLPEGIDSANWVARHFLEWWRDSAVAALLGDAESAAESIRAELMRLGGFGNADLGEAMHESIHLKDALGEIKELLGISAK